MKRWLDGLPTTALVTVTGCVLAVFTSLFYFAAELRGHQLDGSNFGLWLGFVASMLGVAYAWFHKKRESYQHPPTESQRVDPDLEGLPGVTGPEGDLDGGDGGDETESGSPGPARPEDMTIRYPRRRQRGDTGPIVTRAASRTRTRRSRANPVVPEGEPDG